MNYLRRISDGVVTNGIDHDSDLYRDLVATEEWEDVNSVQADDAETRVMVGIFGGSALAADETAQLSSGEDRPVTFSAVTYTATAAVTGTDTNSRTILVQAGPDKDTPIPVATLALVAGVNLVAGTPKTITLGTAAVPAGEAIIAKSLHVLTGLVDPGGTIIATYTEA